MIATRPVEFCCGHQALAQLLEGSWPTEALLAEIAVSKHSEYMPLNRTEDAGPFLSKLSGMKYGS